MLRNSCSDTTRPSASTHSADRRRFLGRVGAATAALGIAGFPPVLHFSSSTAQAASAGADDARQRVNKAYQLRHKAALYQKNLSLPDHPSNGDDERYVGRIGSYCKALPHNQRGEVEPGAYNALLRALSTGAPADFERIPLGGMVRQTDPQAALAFELVGSDPHHLGIPAAPAFDSAEEAGEAVELYWQALTRDVPFAHYDTDPLVNAAADELTRLSDFRGPKSAGRVTPATLFRGAAAGDLTGPYISQFLWRDVPYPSTPIVQRIRTGAPGVDYLTGYADWLAIQNGAAAGPMQFDPTRRYVRNNRDLAEYVHRDFPYQLFLNAGLILLGFGTAALDKNNPYVRSQTQSGFSTFGGPHVLDLLARVANCALNATWFQKWLVHRRLRPEEFAGRLHNHRTGGADYPIHAEALNARALDEVFSRHGTYLLPSAFPEGCPTHPAYPAGHAAIAGACATVLKAFFDESFVIQNPSQASADGLSLEPYAGAELTVGGELDKLASNVALGRDAAGVHWRSDGMEGLRLGEAVAVSVLRDLRGCFNEPFEGFALTRFDGTAVTV
jgi:hypothetical protein